jgi:hypothetical protein
MLSGIMLSVLTLSVIIQSVVNLSVVFLSVDMPSTVMMSVVMQNVLAPNKFQKNLNFYSSNLILENGTSKQKIYQALTFNNNLKKKPLRMEIESTVNRMLDVSTYPS